jgi:hypothetical protein
MRRNNPAKKMTPEWQEKITRGVKGKVRTLEQRIRYRNSKLGPRNPNYRDDIEHKYHHKSRILSELEVNHKVVSVEPLPYKADVYCMEVPGVHWFYANKVLVHNCSFCANIKQTFKVQGAERTLQEINYLRHKYGYQAFTIYDDTFTVDDRRLEQMARVLSTEDVWFRCFSRANLLDDETCYWLKTMGVKAVGIGVESGSDEILKINLKGTSTRQNTEAVRNLRKHGIESKAFLIVGLPGETEETVKQTAAWVEEAQPDDIAASVFQPLPGSKIFKNPERFGVKFQYNGRPMWYRGKPGEYQPTIRTKELTTKRIASLRDWLESSYKRPELLK